MCRRGKPLTVEGQISMPPPPAEAAIHFPFGSNATSLEKPAGTFRTECQRPVAGQNVTPNRSSAASHRPVGSNPAPIVVTGPRPSTIGSASGGPVRSHIRSPCPWSAATIHWRVRLNATPLIRSVGFSDEPVRCRGSLAWTNEPTRSAGVSSSHAICSPLSSSQKLDTGVLVRSTIRCPAAPAFDVDASTCRSPGYETK